VCQGLETSALRCEHQKHRYKGNFQHLRPQRSALARFPLQACFCCLPTRRQRNRDCGNTQRVYRLSATAQVFTPSTSSAAPFSLQHIISRSSLFLLNYTSRTRRRLHAPRATRLRSAKLSLEVVHPAKEAHAFGNMSSSGKRFGTLLEMNAGGKIVEAESVEEPARRATAAQMAARK